MAQDPTLSFVGEVWANGKKDAVGATKIEGLARVVFPGAANRIQIRNGDDKVNIRSAKGRRDNTPTLHVHDVDNDVLDTAAAAAEPTKFAIYRRENALAAEPFRYILAKPEHVPGEMNLEDDGLIVDQWILHYKDEATDA